MPKRPSVEKAGSKIIEVMQRSALYEKRDAFVRALRELGIEEGSATERECLDAWQMKRDQIHAKRPSPPRSRPWR